MKGEVEVHRWMRKGKKRNNMFKKERRGEGVREREGVKE